MKAILTKFHGPTNVKGSRISATDSDGNRVIIGYDHGATDPHDQAVIALCEKMGWEGEMVRGTTKDGGAYVFYCPGLNTLKVGAA